MPTPPVEEVAQLRRELERLREENQRLSRLLELRGSEATPTPEQPAVAPPSGGIVTMASPVSDKLVLFTDLFRARTDVYAPAVGERTDRCERLVAGRRGRMAQGDRPTRGPVPAPAP